MAHTPGSVCQNPRRMNPQRESCDCCRGQTPEGRQGRSRDREGQTGGRRCMYESSVDRLLGCARRLKSRTTAARAPPSTMMPAVTPSPMATALDSDSFGGPSGLGVARPSVRGSTQTSVGAGVCLAEKAEVPVRQAPGSLRGFRVVDGIIEVPTAAREALRLASIAVASCARPILVRRVAQQVIEPPILRRLAVQ